jgi:hypothetical protein
LHVLAPSYDGLVTDDQVRMSRPGDDARVLLMSGRTERYAIEPRGEYVFGIVTEQPMRAVRGRERRTVQPGQLVAWDPSGAHSGSAVGGRPWSSRLMVVEVADLAAIAGDEESLLRGDVSLDELATAAGIGKFRLIRLFRDRIGLPPHASTSPTASTPPAASPSNKATPSPTRQPPPASPTKATSTATSSAAWA